MREELGEAILSRAVELARARWGVRLLSAYALGSLAHGGFSPLVSDVDLGLILADPLTPDDARQVAALTAAIRATGLPLAERLSVFWGSRDSLHGRTPGGRFPPLDRLDLIQHGRLLWGTDTRENLPPPTQRELVLGGVEVALRSLAKPEVVAELNDPLSLHGADR
jgi:hypothetical protein